MFIKNLETAIQKQLSKSQIDDKKLVGIYKTARRALLTSFYDMTQTDRKRLFQVIYKCLVYRKWIREPKFYDKSDATICQLIKLTYKNKSKYDFLIPVAIYFEALWEIKNQRQLNFLWEFYVGEGRLCDEFIKFLIIKHSKLTDKLISKTINKLQDFKKTCTCLRRDYSRRREFLESLTKFSKDFYLQMIKNQNIILKVPSLKKLISIRSLFHFRNDLITYRKDFVEKNRDFMDDFIHIPMIKKHSLQDCFGTNSQPIQMILDYVFDKSKLAIFLTDKNESVRSSVKELLRNF